MIFYIIRHAQSENNALADYRDRVNDPSLTELGFTQADILAKHLAEASHPEQRFGRDPEETAVESVQGYGITHLFCSAMHRSLQTAKPVSQALGLDPEVWVGIHESGGIFLKDYESGESVGHPGMTRDEIHEAYPNYVLPEEVTNEGWWDVRAGQEHWTACQGRAVKAYYKLREWAKTETYDTVAIISHAGFIEALIKALTNQLPGEGVYYHHFNTALTRIDFGTDGQLDIRYLNRVPHLPDELVS